MNTIDGFFEEYRWLSNFWPAIVELDGVKYPSVEHAYQAAKTLDHSARIPFSTHYTARDSKQAGKRLTIRDDWESVKIQVMHDLLIQKFAEGTPLADQLLATGSARIVEGNYWNDTFWGVCRGVGKNHLGILLMEIRQSLNLATFVDSM